MGMDAIRFVYEHLRRLSQRPETISLFLHSNGGEGTVPWKLVTLIREYCDRFRVVVPYRAFSAATLTALGADEIYMHPMGMLGPTDPSITGPYNPRDAEGNPLPISVEEVLAYLDLVKEDAGIQHEDELVLAVNKLAENVHPVALGSVKRTHSQSRMIATKLMALAEPRLDEHKIEEIVSNLTSKLYYHGHPINRKEARELGLSVMECSPEVETAIWELYEQYEEDMELLSPFRAADLFIKAAPNLPANSGKLIDVPKIYLVIVESRLGCHALVAENQIFGTKDANGAVQTQVYTNRLEWETCEQEAKRRG